MTWRLPQLMDECKFAYLVEALKVEGYWSVKSREASIQNKDLGLLRYIESIFESINLPVTKRYLVKLKPTHQDFGVGDICVTSSGHQIPVRIEYSLFDDSRKIVFNLPFSCKQECIISVNNYAIPLKISCESVLDIICEQQAFVYLELRTHAVQLLRLLNIRSGGRGAHNIRLTPSLWCASPNVVAAALSALIDCEGSIDLYESTRRLRIRMTNRNYLHDWKMLLAKFNIEAGIGKDNHLYCLSITGLYDFRKLQEIGMNLKHSIKSCKWEKVLNSYTRNGSVETLPKCIW